MPRKIIIVGIIVLIVLVLGLYFIINSNNIGMNNGNNNANPITYEIQGMKVEILENGNGDQAKIDDFVTTHYTGTFQDGSVFDSSLKRNEPLVFQLGQDKVIKGWDLGVLGMKIGEKRRLTIPYELAYGPDGYPPIIPPKATLIFEITLLKIN